MDRDDDLNAKNINSTSSNNNDDDEKKSSKSDQLDSENKFNLGDLSKSDEKPIDDHLEILKSIWSILKDVLPEIAESLKNIQSGDVYNFTNSNISQSAVGPNAKQILSSGTSKNKIPKKTKGSTGRKNNWLEWFKEKRIQEQAFIASLVFFSGNSPRFVMGVTDELVRLLGVRIETENIPSSIFERGVPISQFLQDGVVKITQESINTEAGKLSFDAISFESSEAMSFIRQIVLENHDLIGFRSVVNQWLISLIKSDNKKLQNLGSLNPDLPRIQAGLGLGILARNKLNTLPQMVKPWADSENPGDRLMVGWILLGYFEEVSQSTYWSNVSFLLKHWSSLDNYYFRWTAIASTTRLGLIVSPEDDSSLILSMSVFKEVCKSGQVNLFRGAFRGVLLKSLRFLFSLSTYHARVISMELASWLKDDRSLLQDLGSELFVELVGITISADCEEFDSKGVSIWDLCETESYTLSDAICQLISRALIHEKGTFVDYTIKQLSKSLQKFFERELSPQKAVKDIFSQLRQDKLTARYVPLILGNYQNRI